MDEARALFLSLPPAAQTRLRAAVGRKESINLPKLARAAYPYVQTLADAQDIAEFLANEELGYLDCPAARVNQCVLKQTLREIHTMREYAKLKDKCDACAAGHELEVSGMVGLSHAR